MLTVTLKLDKQRECKIGVAGYSGPGEERALFVMKEGRKFYRKMVAYKYWKVVSLHFDFP